MACSHRQKASIAQPVPCKHHLHSPHPALLSQLSPVSSLKAILKSHRRDPLSSILDRSPVLSLTAHHVTLGEFLPSGAQHPHLPRADRLMVAGEAFTSDVEVSLDSPDLLCVWAQPPFVLGVFWLDPLHLPGQNTACCQAHGCWRRRRV